MDEFWNVTWTVLECFRSLNFWECVFAMKRKSGPSCLATAMERETGALFREGRRVVRRQVLREETSL